MTDVPPASSPSVSSANDSAAKTGLILFGMLLLGLGVAFRQTLLDFQVQWSKNPENAFGWIVPLFSLGLLYLRWEMRPALSSRYRLAGALLMGLGVAVMLVSRRFYAPDLGQGLGLVTALCGAVLMAFGWSTLLWALPALLYLILMVPMPDAVQTFMRRPLRRFGTLSSTYILQSLGLFASATGNVITVGDVQVGVADACSGLRMLMVFLAICIAMAMISERPLWERAVLVVSAIPIALIANIFRIVATAICLSSFWSDEAKSQLHDLMGYLMMPLGLVLVGIEAWLLARLLLVEKVVPVVASTHRPRPAESH